MSLSEFQQIKLEIPRNNQLVRRLSVYEVMDQVMLGQVGKSLSALEVQLGFEEEDDKVQSQVNKAMDLLQQQELERLLEEKIRKIKKVADDICNENPKNFLFITQYGGELTVKQLATDKQTDIDLRLICIKLPTRKERIEILAKLQAAAGDIPVEIYFDEVSNYSKGIVGETGNFTTLEVIREGIDPKFINTKIDHPEIFALYTFGTTRFFSNKSDADIAIHINLATKEYTYNDLIPEAIFENIKPNNESAIDWLHEYLGKFIAEHKAINLLSSKGELTTEILRGYLKRLSKYVIRIAFGVSIIDEDLEAFKVDYLEQLKLPGIHADQAHIDLISTINKSWLNQIVNDLLKDALDLRVNSKGFADEKVDITNDDETNNLELLIEQQKRMENVLLFIAQQAGGLSRIKEFNSIYDFLNIISLKNVLQTNEKNLDGVEMITLQSGVNFIHQGGASEEMYVLPSEKNNGETNGSVNIVVHNTITLPERIKPILGELGVLSGQPRSVSVNPNGDVEAMVISKQFLEKLFDSKTPNDRELLFKGFLHSRVDTDDFEIFNKVLLIFSFLNYFSNEFVQYLYEQIEYQYKFSDEEQPDNILSKYKVDNFIDIIKSMASAGKIKAKEIVFDESTNLFSNGDQNDDFFYIVTETGENGGVRLSFTGDSEGKNDLIIKSGDIVGESSLILGDKVRNHTATLPPGTKVLRVDATEFKKVNNNTDVIQTPIKNGSELAQITGIELMIHLSLLCLDRLQKVKQSY